MIKNVFNIVTEELENISQKVFVNLLKQLKIDITQL